MSTILVVVQVDHTYFGYCSW